VRVSSGRCHAVPSSRIASSGARRFEVGQPGVTIVTPGRPGDRWRAVLPLGVLPTTARPSARSLCDLMDQLDQLYPVTEAQAADL
jgi:hypothetical protein